MIRKNRSENGRRVEELESNPHSKGEDFSRLSLNFAEIIKDRIIKIKETTKMDRTRIAKVKIIFSRLSPSGWKPDILKLYLKDTYLISKLK